MRPLRIIRGLGGNGSTFVSRVVAAMDKVVLLSETNPQSANLFSFALNPVTQVAKNYPHLNINFYTGNMVELGSPDLFGEYVMGLLRECESIEHNLVIRDYNYVDYIGTPFVWTAQQKSSLDFALKSIQTKEILLIRHPTPQLVSLLSHGELKNVLGYRAFLRGYRTMLEQHQSARLTRYEDLFSAFDDKMPEIAAYLLLPITSEWKTQIQSIDWVTGHEFGKTSSLPEVIQQRLNSEMLDLLRPVEDYRIICKSCGYDP
jgi:hypothetical protein